MVSGVQARLQSCDALLAEAGIAAELLQEPSARVTADQYVALFRILMERLDDECLGFLSRPVKRGSLALMTRSAISAPTLEVAVRRVMHTFRLLQDDVVLEPVRDGPSAGLALRFTDPSVVYPTFLHELLLRIFWRLLAWLAGGRLPASRFDFAFECPPYAGSYGKVFPAPLHFGCRQSAFWFDAAQPARLDLAATAAALHMSTSTLQRRLASEGSSFQSLKDELRRDTAIVRLHTSTVPLATLADELGFADSAAFQRAFKGWTGSAPGAYRRGGT
jgi:AraC-like DNA-binding protein